MEQMGVIPFNCLAFKTLRNDNLVSANYQFVGLVRMMESLLSVSLHDLRVNEIGLELFILRLLVSDLLIG